MSTARSAVLHGGVEVKKNLRVLEGAVDAADARTVTVQRDTQRLGRKLVVVEVVVVQGERRRSGAGGT